jgi:hypothetical protein
MIISLEWVQKLFSGLLDWDSFSKTFHGWHATFSVYRRVVTSIVAVRINSCFYYLLWVEVHPLRGNCSMRKHEIVFFHVIYSHFPE